MASGGAEADDGGIPLDIDSMHMLLQVEHEQIQKRTFTNWINAQLAKRCPPSFVSDLFSDLRHGSQLLDLLEVMSGQPMKRQKGHGLFQQRADIETALSFLKKKSIKLVNINIPDIIDGRSSIILGLVWTIILHCHIEELASTLSFSSRHSSFDSLTSLDSWSGSPVPSSPVPLGQTPPLHRHFRISAKKALLMWVRDQCQRVGSSVSVKDFKSSWRSGEAFLVVLCSLRPQLVDLSLVQSRSNQENLEEAFHLAERELHIPRLLEPQDVDVKDPDEKSIMTYVAQFLQYSNDMPAPDDHLQLFPLDQPPCSSPVNLSAHVTPAIAVSPSRQVSPNVRAQEMTSWLQRAYQELSDAWLATEESSYAEKYQVFQNLAGSFNEQRRPVMTHLATIRHRPELSREQHALRTAWDCLEEELQRCKTELDLSLPPPLDIVAVWLQRAEAALAEDGGRGKDHADAAKEARAQHDTLKTLIQEMGHHVQTLDAYHNMDNTGNVVVPPEKFDEIKRRVTHIQVSAKYKEIKLEYQESCHNVLDLLGQISAKVQTWKAPCRSKEAVHGLLQDWNETVEHQGMLLILMEALQNLKEKANAYTSTAALSEDSQLVLRQVKEAESEVELATQTVMTVRGMMERMVSAWETYSKCLTSLQTWLEQTTRSQTQSAAEISERTSCQAQLNEVGNFLIEVTETSTSCSLAEQLRKVNMQWAEYMKRIKFELPSGPSVGPPCLQMVHSLTQEASWLLRQPLEVASVPLKANRQKLQLLRKKMADMDLSCLSPSPDFQTSHIENFQHTLPQMLVEAERTCGELQRAASRLEGHLAEMDRWSTDALDCFQHLKEKEHRGRSAPEPRGLISRGLQLENQVVTGEQGLQDLVARVQKTSPLCHLSTSGMQDRISEALSLCQSNKTSPLPPAVVHSEVHSKAQSMAKSRLERVRFRLQGRIQQAIRLFGGKEISESQAKKKQRALKILQTAVLEEFLDAVEGFGAFCSGPQLQDLMLLSDSVRKQWEAATEGAASIEEHVKSLQELRETLTPCKSSCLATDQLKESEINVIVVRGDTVETRQDAEWTIIPETVAPPEEEHPLDQEVLKRYRTSCLVFQSQLQKNKQHLEQVIPHPVTISTLLNQKKQLQLRGKLEKVHSAAQALDRFLATVREVRAEIPTLLSSQDPSGQQNEAVWEQERHSWQAAMQQRLQTAAEQSGGVDSSLRAAGLTLTMDGATVMCQDVVTSLSKDIVDVEVKLIKSRKRGSQDKSDPVVKEQMQGNEESNPVGVHQTKTVDTSPQQGGAQEQEHPPPSTAEEKSRLEAKRSRQGGEEDTKTQRVEEHKSETWRSEGGVKDQRSSELKKGGKEKESLVQRRDALLGALREIRAAAEQLALQEPTLPALQHRLDQCCGLTQLLKRFQSLRGELSGTLQRAESIISEQASYVGKDNLQRLHTKIQETKAELSGLGDRIEDVRNVCRQLHTHLRHRPEHTIVPFESEADALMDQWLDISERTDSHLENLHLGLTLWEGVLQLGAEVESWTTSQLAVFAQSLSFQTEDGIKTLQNDIVAQEERMDHFHQRAAEIQSLLHSTELPVELQVVEIQMRKKMEQLKELVSEAEDYRQKVAAKGQITVRMAECFNSLQKIQDSLVTLSGSDIATVLAKLKDGSRLQEKVRNTHQLFSETEEQTARNIQDLDRMQRECEHLEKWLQAAEEKAVKEENLGLLQEEVLQQRVRTELLSQLVSALQNSTLQQSVLVEESSKLLEQYHNFHTNIQCSSKDKQQTLSRDIEVFQALSKSTQAWVEDLRRAADSPLSLGIQSPVEQKLHRAQALVSVTAEGEARLEELRVTGNSLSQRVCDRVDLKQEVKETIQKTEEQWTNLLQSLEPYYRVLQTGSELTSSYLAQRQEACCRVEALQRQTAQLPTLFPWPGTAERRHACLLARHLWDETESLQLTLTTLAEKRRDLAEQTNDTIWKDSSWVELDTCWSGLMAELKGVCSCLEEGVINEECFGQLLQDCDHELMSLQETMSACQAQKESSVGLLTDVPALEALLQKVTSVEKDLLQLVALKDSLTSSSTAEAQASLSQQVTNLQNHKRVLDSSIREKLTLLKENGNQRVQQVKEEVACVQAALKDLTENVQMLYGNHEVSPDISQLKQQWGTIQLCDTRLTELVARLYNMQKTGESKEMLHADAILAVDAVTKDIDSIKSIFLQKKHECAESTAVRVKQAISQLQQWSRTVQAQPSSPSQAALDEGLQLQHSLREVLSEKDFLLNCLGSKVSKSLEKEASNALSESTLALEMLSKYLVSQGPSDLDNEDLTGESVEESFRSECGAPHSAPPDESMVTCPPAFLFPSADDKMENSGTDQNDNKMKSKGCLDLTEPITNASGESNVVADATKQDQAESLMQTSKEQTFVPNHVPSADIPEFSNSKTQQQSQQLTHAKSLTAQTGTASNKDVSLAHCVTSLVGLPSTKPDNILLSNPENVFEHLIAQSQMFQEQEKHCEDLRTTPKKVLTVVLEMEPQDMQINVNVGPDILGCSQKTKLYDAELMAVSGTDSTEKKSGLLMLTGPESDKPDLKKHNLAAQSEIFKAGPVVHRDEDISSNKVFTIMLDMEQSEHDWASTFDSLRCLKGSEPCDAKLSDVSSTGIPEKKSGLFTALISPESVLRSHYLKSLKSHVSQVEDSLSESTELEEVKSTSAKLSSTENSDTHELMRSEVLNSSSSCETFSECQLTGAHAAETKFVAVKPEEVTDFCHMEEQTVSSVLCTVEASVQLGDTLTEMQIPAGDSKELMGADTAQSTDIGHAEMAEGEEVEEASDPKCPESKDSKMVQTQDSALLLEEECDSGLPSSLEDTREMQEQPEIQEGMEAEKTTLVSSADLGAGDATGGSSESCKRRSTMQDILSEIESLVERRNINRTPHMDLNWYLKCCPGESEIQLVRTVQRVLACRYQPAQLDVTAMAKQLQEAEEYRHCVQEQVAIIKGISAARVCDPDALKSAEGQWNAALLDASATVQVKAAQLEKVKQYHKQMKMIRAFLEVVATEKEKSSLNALGSSAVQTDKLHTLLQTMKGKKGMMEELLQLRSQLSVLLSDAESLAALLAQLGDVQEEWRLLEGSIKRALGHASNSTSQFVLLMKEADQLKAKLEALQKSSFQSSDNKSDLELVCLTTDLKLYIQLYLDLQSQSDALVHFCLGQKEQGEIQHNLQELGSLLNVTKRKLDTFSCRSNSSVKVNKQLQDLIIWAKKAENHISIGQRLALFPEEAHIQIVEMKKFQTDILSRHSKLQVQVEELKDLTADTEKEESNQVLKTIEELYEAVADSVDHVLDKMKKNLRERQKLLIQLSSLDAWLAKKYAARDPCTHIESVSRADIQKLESELECHKLDTVEIESQLNLLEVMAESCKDISVGLSPGESRHLVNRLSGLWMQLDGLLAHEKATSWELEGLIHEQTFSDEELSNIQGSLKIISTDLNQQRSPLKQETLSTIVHLKHMLMEHQCQVQELQHCQEDKRSSLLYTIGELQDRCRAVSLIAFEQDQYFHLRRQMEESMDIAKEQMQHIRDDTISMDERFTLCQTLLVELPLAKTLCQKTSDQLEAIAHELLPAELNSERQRIHSTMETLLSWEHSVTDDIKNLEAKLLFGLQFSIELPALIDLFQRTRVELEAAKPVSPDEKAIDDALQKYWVIWRNMESGMRVLEGLGRKEKINLKNYKELHSFRDAAMQECRLRMENLSQARESLKDYHLAAQGAIGFLRNAEATFLSAPGGFLDCSEEQQQTQQALAALEDGFQACSCHLVELVPQQPCLSRPKIEQLHIRILSQLLVGRAVLEAQAQLRLESLQRCSIRQQSHRRFHEDVQQRLSRFEARLSECAATQVTSYDKCVAQQKRATLMMEDLHSLSRKIEELRAGCPRRRCGVGKDSELGALWRRWASLRRGIGLLMAHTEQKGEEWKDITTSMEQCCSILASLQAEVPDSSTVTSTQEEPQELLAHAELHQAGLEQVQQALASLQHRLEHALSLSTSQDPISPGPAGKTLVKIQENVRSLKERNLLVVAAAQAEENERLQVQDKIEEVEKHVSATLLMLEACSDPSKQQELKKDLSSQKAKLQCIMEGVRSRYAEIPADISRRLQVVHLSLQRSEEKHIENSKVVQNLVGQVAELSSGLEKVKVLLEQRSPTVSEAQNVLKRVWDNLDAWHSCLMLLESEVQDLAEEQTDQVHLLMDQLTEPLQLYQKIAQRAEQRTSFLSKIPTSLQEFEDILCSATCWLDEAQSWLTAPCSFTTARSLQSHANSLQLVLDDSKRIRDTLQDFRPVLAEISAVCDIRAQEGRLDQNDQQIQKMQRNILGPLEQLLQTVAVVEAMEAELKTMEKNVPKIRTILSSMENSNIPLTEHVHNRQVILANVQLMRRTLEDMEKCRTELHLPQGAEESPLIFSRAKLLLQSLTELENLTQQQTSRLEQEDFEASNSVEEEEEDDESCHSSSSDTLTCSVPEDPEETLGASDVQSDAIAEITPPSDVQELESLSHHFSSKVETSSKGAVLLSVKSWFDSCDFGATAEFVTMDSTADAAEASATTESLTTAATPAADDGFTVTDVLELCESPTDESLVSDPHTKSIQAAAAVEDTGLTPASPVTPFTAIRASVNFTEERDDLSSSTDLDTPSGLKTQGEVSTSQSSVEESKAALESKVPVSPTRHEDGKEQISQLYTQLSPKRTTLKKVEEYQTLISSEDGGAHEKELASNLLCFLDELDLGQSEISSLKDARSLEQCVLGRHLRESPGEKAKLQQVSQSLLQGLTRLLELGEERIREMQMNQVHNCSQHQAILCGHQKLLQFLRSQLAFVQHLFQCEPEALRYQEDERVQLEIRAKALQQQAVEQEAASQRRLQEWTHWEDNCGRLGRVLDEFDAFIISGEPEGEDDEDFVVQHRLDACQQTLVQLDESRAALGLLLDQRNVLRMYPAFAASVSQTGGALELRWRAAYSRTEQEIQRCRDIQDSRARFQTNFASVSKWLVGANKHLKSLSDLADTCDLNQECLHSRLIQLLDFCMEVEAMSVQRASVSRTVTRLIQLREDHCLGLRAQLAQLDVSWSQLTSDLSTIQDQLQQQLLAAWPPVQLLSDLEDWLKMLEGRLSQEKETVLKAKDAAQVIEALQHYQELKAGVDSGQLLLDFLCQHGPQAGAANDQALQSERTMFAETLGSLRLQWLHLQWELGKQVHEAEQIHHTCADRERRLQQLHGWIVQQKKQLNQWKQSTSQTLVQKALLDWEAVVGRAREVAEALQELKATRVHAEKEEAQPCDIAFSNQAESISHACEDLGQQMEVLRPTLQQTVAEWSCFDQDLREVTLLTTRVRCALQHQQAPLLSLKQAEEYMNLLQQLQEKAGKGGDLWTGVEKSYQSLVKTLHHGVVQALDEQVEGERKWWKDVVWELKEEHVKTGETLSLWQEYSLLSDHCSLHLQNLWHQWEELLSSSSSPERDTQALVYSVKKLQDAAEGLKSIVDDALAASKRLMERLEPSATNLVQSEISLRI
uniref:nesprin-1-like n=1 Tax=Monopterus albus TaxID=43700 RepID=UPI0009B32951|nr:nesprin-1-like [Monopterus albus]